MIENKGSNEFIFTPHGLAKKVIHAVEWLMQMTYIHQPQEN